MRLHSTTTFVMALVLAASAAAAQAAPDPAAAPKAAPVSTQPQSTSATYGDWALVCQQVVLTGTETRRICEISQTLQAQGVKEPIAQIAFGRPQKADPLNMTVLLPVNIALDKGVKVFSEASDGVAADLSWRKCTPGGCFADTKVSADILKRWRTAGERGRIELRNANGQDVALPISLRGFAQAMDALPTD